MYTKILFKVSIVVLLLTFTSLAKAQFTIVQDASVRTADNVIFNIWLESHTILLGKDIRVNYKVENHSRRPIYLVRQDESEYRVIDNYRTIEVLNPFPSSTGHGGYDFKFTKIPPNKIHKGYLLVSGKLPNRDGLWSINVGFGYVSDIVGLVPPPPDGGDPAPWRGLLGSRMEGVSVGKLTVQTKNSTPLQ